jgi:hypothetical protein
MPFFQVSFTYFSDFEQLPNVPGLSVAPLKTVAAEAMYDLDLNLVERQGVLTATFEYKKALFDAGTIAGLLGALVVAIAVVTDNCDVRLSQLCQCFKKAEEERASALVKEREEKLRARVMQAGRRALRAHDRKRSNV